MVYKWCVVPQCTNTSINNSKKRFFSVPTNAKRRKKWLELARRDPNSIVDRSNVFMCEDHFDMEKDIGNYMKYKMGYSQKLLLDSSAVPSKFHCQEDDAGTREVLVKRQRKDLNKEGDKDSISNISPNENLKKDDNSFLHEIIDIDPEELSIAQDKETFNNLIRTADKSVQVATKVHYRSKSVQTVLLQKSISTSPCKTFISPFKIETCHTSGYGDSRRVSSSSMASDSGSVSDVNENVVKLQRLRNTRHAMHKKSLMYVGIPEDCYSKIHLMQKSKYFVMFTNN